MRKLLWWAGVPAVVATPGPVWVTVFPTHSEAG